MMMDLSEYGLSAELFQRLLGSCSYHAFAANHLERLRRTDWQARMFHIFILETLLSNSFKRQIWMILEHPLYLTMNTSGETSASTSIPSEGNTYDIAALSTSTTKVIPQESTRRVKLME